MRVESIVAACLAISAFAAPAGAVERQARVKGIGKVTLVDHTGASLPRVKYNGQTYVIGKRGQVFGLKVKNEGARRMEAVIAVDGRDVLTGKPAKKEARGYIIGGGTSETIKGWRTSQSSVAEFKFADAGEGYDAQMGGSGEREGLVGVAIYHERLPEHLYVMGAAGGMRRGGLRGGATSLGLEGTRDLSTDFGREITDHVSYTTFLRSTQQPAAVLQLSYGTAKSLIKAGVPRAIVERALTLGSAELNDDDEPGAFADDPPARRGDYAPYPPGYRGRGR